MSLYFKVKKVLKFISRKKPINLNKSLSKKHIFEWNSKLIMWDSESYTVIWNKFLRFKHPVLEYAFLQNLPYAVQTLSEIKHPKLWATKDFLNCLNTQLLISWKVPEFSFFSTNQAGSGVHFASCSMELVCKTPSYEGDYCPLIPRLRMHA
jgi:hypothetical protein